jgi:hypothetical protein
MHCYLNEQKNAQSCIYSEIKMEQVDDVAMAGMKIS